MFYEITDLNLRFTLLNHKFNLSFIQLEQTEVAQKKLYFILVKTKIAKYEILKNLFYEKTDLNLRFTLLNHKFNLSFIQLEQTDVAQKNYILF